MFMLLLNNLSSNVISVSVTYGWGAGVNNTVSIMQIPNPNEIQMWWFNFGNDTHVS